MSSGTHEHIEHVAVVGGGIIGLSIAWKLVRAGCRTTLFDAAEAGHASSWAAAGMLAPHSEVGFEEEPFLHLGVESVRRFPAFLDELAEDSGRRIEIDDGGSLIVGFDRDDAARMRRVFDFRAQLGLPIEWLTAGEARNREPMLSPKVTAAISLADDTQVNSRSVVVALRDAFTKRGGTLREHTPVETILSASGRVVGVRTSRDEVHADAVVIAAGCWSNRIDGVPEGMRPPVRPVKGQIIALHANADCPLTCVVRAPDVYLMRKDDGRILVGATQEEMGFNTRPTAGAIKTLLEKAWEAVPSIYDLELASIDVGLRPGSRDNQPIIGAGPMPGLWYATGHFRHGILLAPVTADAIAGALLGRGTEPLVEPFVPSRFWSRSLQ